MEKIFNIILGDYFPKGEIEETEEGVFYTIKNVNRNQRYEIKKIIKSETHKSKLHVTSFIDINNGTYTLFGYEIKKFHEAPFAFTIENTDYKKYQIIIYFNYDLCNKFKVYKNIVEEKIKLQELYKDEVPVIIKKRRI